MTKIAFGGEAFKADCECHKGKIIVEVYTIHPRQGKVVIGDEIFDTLPEAKQNMQAVVKKYSEEFLRDLGLNPDESDRIDIFEGDKAHEEERKYINETNVNLH